MNCIVSVNEKHLFIGIFYRPPHSKSIGLSKSAFFEEWENYLNNLITLKHEILLTGDINFHLDSTSSPDTKKFLVLIMMLYTCQRLIIFKVLRTSGLIKEIRTNSLNIQKLNNHLIFGCLRNSF